MDRQILMRIECRLRAGFELHGGANIVVPRNGGARIPKQQALTVWVIRIYDDARPVRFDSGLRKGRADDAFELAQERFLDVFAARRLDGVKLAWHGVSFRSGLRVPKWTRLVRGLRERP